MAALLGQKAENMGQNDLTTLTHNLPLTSAVDVCFTHPQHRCGAHDRRNPPHDQVRPDPLAYAGRHRRDAARPHARQPLKLRDGHVHTPWTCLSRCSRRARPNQAKGFFQMAHNIDMTNGRANMAFMGDRKDIWHRLGAQMPADASIDTWASQAGLAW